MFTTLIVQPIFNLLALIYAVLPGHDFGLAIIIFTVLTRLLMWPLIKKQLYHTKQLQKLQPEIRRIKAVTKGDRQKEQLLTMELYKERQINPFATLGLTLLQFPILIGLWLALRRLIDNPHHLIDFSYPFVRDLSWIKQVGGDIGKFHTSFLGLIDLKKTAVANGHWYWPALTLVVGSAIAQYFQSKQLLPNAGDKKTIRQILKEASAGKKADQAEMQAATGKYTTFIIPVVFFFISLRFVAALPLYWLTSSLVALWQQARVLSQDEAAMEQIADRPTGKTVIEGQAVTRPTAATAKPTTAAKVGSKPSAKSPKTSTKSKKPARNKRKKRS